MENDAALFKEKLEKERYARIKAEKQIGKLQKYLKFSYVDKKN
jgi:hypothetical protein